MIYTGEGGCLLRSARNDLAGYPARTPLVETPARKGSIKDWMLTMDAEDLVSQLQMHGQPDSTVIVVLDGKDHALTGTVIGDSDEGEVYIYID